MSDVIFVNILGTPIEKDSEMIFPSPAFAYFKSYLNKIGYLSKDIFIARDEAYSKLVNIDQFPSIEKILTEEKPKVVAFSPLTPTYNKSVEIVKIVKRILPNTITCIGNTHATAFPKQALKDGFDHVFLNEGFSSFVNFASKVLSGDKILTPIIPEEPMLDLNSVPFAHYDTQKPSVLGLQTGSIFTSFSCPFRCRFCSNFYFTGSHGRRMSPERVVKEIKHQYKCWGFTFFNFGDATILPNETSFYKMEEINNLLDKMKINFEFFLSCRLDIIAQLEKEKPELLDSALRKATIFFVGIESINNRILDSYDKRISSENAKRGLEALVKRGKIVFPSFILGGPLDNHDTIEDIISFIRENSIAYGAVNIFTPLPLTPYYNEFENGSQFITNNWDLFDFRHLVFKHPVFQPGELESIRHEIKENYMGGEKEDLKRDLNF
jgi:radical SAM superfamily enzyme YgiQ (UPF0313 family)